MRPSLSTVIGYVTTPLLIALHIYTQSPAVIYIFGLLATVTLVISAVALTSLVLLIKERAVTDRDLGKRVSPVKIAVMLVYSLGAFSYLVYTESFVAASIYFVAAVTSFTLVAVVNMFLDSVRYR